MTDVVLPGASFWFLRHGETDYNAKGLSQGAIDISLNANGRTQAQAAAVRLKDRGITSIFCSPMLRTRETAAIVNEVLHLPIVLEPDLREVVFGGMEGKPLLPWFHDWVAGRMTPPGAETFAALTARIAGVLPRVLAHPGPVLLVAHGGVFRAVREVLGLPDAGMTANAVPLLCAPSAEGWEMRAST